MLDKFKITSEGSIATQAGCCTVPAMLLRDVMELHRTGRLREAERGYRQLLDADPGDVYALHWLGMLLHQTRRDSQGIELMRRSVADAPHVPEFHKNLGTALFASGFHEQGMTHLREAVRLDPHYARAQHNLAVALEALGKFEDSVAAYDRAIEIDPNYAEAHTNRGNALRKLGRLHDSIAAHNKAIALRPDFPEAHNNLTGPLNDEGRLDEVLECYEKLVRLRSGRPVFHAPADRIPVRRQRLAAARPVLVVAPTLRPLARRECPRRLPVASGVRPARSLGRVLLTEPCFNTEPDLRA